MKRLLAAALGAVLTVAVLSAGAPAGPAVAVVPQKIIVDLDIEADTDDVGALAVLHALADAGEVEILAMTVDTTNAWGPSAVDAINTYYGRPNIPIGQYKGTLSTPGSPGAYNEVLSRDFPQSLGTPAPSSSIPNAVTLLRSTLAAQPDDSVAVVALGFLNNLRALLDSPADSASPLTGMALVDQKVKTLAIMGGYYPSGTDDFNWGYDKTSAARVINHWPGYVLFSGLGADVGTGPRLASETPAASPTRRAYAIFPGATTLRPSWDQVVILAAARGATGPFSSVRGTNSYNASTGLNTFTASASGPHAYLTQTVSSSTLATQIENLMVHVPATAKPANGVYRITAAHSGKVLGIDGCSSTGAVTQKTWNNTNCEKWRLTSLGNGTYRVASELTGKVLDVWNVDTADAAVVVQHNWLNGSNQKWSFGAVGNGTVRIVAAHSGKNLDVANVSTADGAAIWQYRWLGGSNQQWTLEYVGP